MKKQRVIKRLCAGLCMIALLTMTACTGNDSKTASEEQVSKTTEVEEEDKSTAETSTSDTAVDAGIFVNKVEGMDEDFMKGVDISSYLSERNSGVKFYDFEGNELDEQGFFDFLSSCGLNYVRIRVWNNPYDENGNCYGGGNNDLTTAVTMGQYATKAGMRICIDFHYSDFWADPSKQYAPKAWSDMKIDEKADALGSYTTESMQTLLDAGVDVGMVQIGNETNGSFCGESGWAKMSKLFAAGTEAARAVSAENRKDILIALHFANPETENRYLGYARDLNKAGIDYDVFASSYYPYWHGTLENLTELLTQIAEKYDKKVLVAENSWCYTYEDGDGNANTISHDSKEIAMDYAVSVQGQATEMTSVMEAVTAVGEAGIGYFYWEPAWIPVQVYDSHQADASRIVEENKVIWETYGSGWAAAASGAYDADAAKYYGGSAVDNQALFDFEGHPLESLLTFLYVKTGAVAPVSITNIQVTPMEYEEGDTITLPEYATITYNNGESKEVQTKWDEDKLQKAIETGIGEYIIPGTVEVNQEKQDMECSLVIKEANFLDNGGFEDTDMSMWNISADCVGRIKVNNKRSGDFSLKFWSASAVEYTVEQAVTLEHGTYGLSAWLQGGDAGDTPKFTLYAVVNDMVYTADTGVTVWQEWTNPAISDIAILEDNTQITVGVKVQAAPGAWGAWDDFTLYKQ